MEWHRITVDSQRHAAVELQILDWFEKLILALAATGRPTEGIAVFSTAGWDKEAYCYFTPEASEWADRFIQSYSGEPCEPPSPEGLALLCGYLDAWGRLQGTNTS